MHSLKGLLVVSLAAWGVACGSSTTAPNGESNAGHPSIAGAPGNGLAGSGGAPSAAGAGTVPGGSGGTGAGAGSANSAGSATVGVGGTATGGASNNAGGAGGKPSGSAGAPPVFTPYVPAWQCLVPVWPTATGAAVNISATRTIAANTVYDGKMALHNGSGSGDFAKDCSASGTASQGTTDPLFILEDGATIQNVIVGNHGADGIHCKGSCTIKNVWFPYVCDDEVTALSGSSGTVTIDGGGAKNAHDKLFQDNGHGKFVIQNFYGEKLGKMYRACGEGGACDSTKGNVTLTNVTAVGVDQIVGVTKGRDTASFSKICTFQTPTICQMYDSSDNALTDGPDATTCKYKWTDTQVMLNRTSGAFATASECPNYLTSGSTTNPATACLADLPACIKGCLPGDNGLKMCDCTGPGNTYKCHACALPSEDPAKSALAPAKAMAATACPSSVVKNQSCTPEWNICMSGTQYCACVFKPGTLQTANSVWDCANPWW